MRREWLWALALALLLSSAALGWMAWERGEVELYIFLIFPVLKAEGAYGAAAFLLAFASLILIIFSFWTGVRQEGPDTSGRTSVGGVIMIGPIPIVLGSDRRTTIITLVLALVVLMMIILLLVQ
ncbi:MAG: DUF131 domain-containing protein [Methanomassiliicoccales archaeon]